MRVFFLGCFDMSFLRNEISLLQVGLFIGNGILFLLLIVQVNLNGLGGWVIGFFQFGWMLQMSLRISESVFKVFGLRFFKSRNFLQLLMFSFFVNLRVFLLSLNFLRFLQCFIMFFFYGFFGLQQMSGWQLFVIVFRFLSFFLIFMGFF